MALFCHKTTKKQLFLHSNDICDSMDLMPLTSFIVAQTVDRGRRLAIDDPAGEKITTMCTVCADHGKLTVCY